MKDPPSAALRPRVLVVDDEPAMQRMIVNYMREHELDAAATADQAGLFTALETQEPDIVILDLRLGKEDGLDLLRKMRARSIVPVILITGHRIDEVDRVIGLELGADDYMTKPFSLRELLARVRAALRRRSMDDQAGPRRRELTYEFAGWRFVQRLRRLQSPSGDEIALTKGEFALLSAFVASPGRPLTREHLLQTTRVYEDVYDRSIDVQILRLRRKLQVDAQAPQLIRTRRGLGYVFDTDVQVA